MKSNKKETYFKEKILLGTRISASGGTDPSHSAPKGGYHPPSLGGRENESISLYFAVILV